jgi:hypothetical protein
MRKQKLAFVEKAKKQRASKELAADFYLFHLKTRKMQECINNFSKVNFSINFLIIFG